jgi:hypothetical protein
MLSPIVRHVIRTCVQVFGFAMALAPVPVHAQANRAAIVDSARSLIDDFKERQSISLLQRAVNPALGALDATWARGVQLLAQTLLQTSQRDEANAWLRWALRLSPSLQVDSVNFTPALVAAFLEARTFVASARPVPRATVRFDWATATAAGGFGDLRVDRTGGDSNQPVQLTVNGEFLDVGRPRRLAPGSYRILARATGLPDADVATEVLPGVTTVVTVDVTSAVAAVPAAVQPPTAEPSNPVPPRNTPINGEGQPKKRSKLLPILGGIAVGGIIAAVAGGGGGGGEKKTITPTTGTLRIPLP